jgi:hypothetical protein
MAIVNLPHRNRGGPKRLSSKKKKNNLYKCGLLCGRIATGAVKITEKISLRLCDTCHQLLDPDDKMEWIPFD